MTLLLVLSLVQAALGVGGGLMGGMMLGSMMNNGDVSSCNQVSIKVAC